MKEGRRSFIKLGLAAPIGMIVGASGLKGPSQVFARQKSIPAVTSISADPYKVIVHYKLKEGVDPEKFWKDWGENYAACYLGQSGLTRYIISRFIETHGNREDPEQEDRLWGMASFWYQDRDSYEKTQKDLRKDKKIKTVLDEFESQLAWKWAAQVEERLLVDSGYTEMVSSGENPLKLLVTFRLKENMNGDDGWKLWIVGHTQHHLHIGVRKYASNRVIKVLEGDTNKRWGRVWGMPELWYNSKEDCDYDHSQSFVELETRPDDTKIFEDFHKYTDGNWGAFMEEKVIIF